jgi:hypothetical protein
VTWRVDPLASSARRCDLRRFAIRLCCALRRYPATPGLSANTSKRRVTTRYGTTYGYASGSHRSQKSQSAVRKHVALLGNAYGAAGDRAKAARIVEWLASSSRSRYVSPMDLAIAHLGTGDRDSTFRWLEKAYDARIMRIQELGQPMFDMLRGDPRYDDLLRRLGLANAT